MARKPSLMSVAKKMFKPGGASSSKGMHRPEGAGNFDNMDDYNIVESIDILHADVRNSIIFSDWTPTCSCKGELWFDDNKFKIRENIDERVISTASGVITTSTTVADTTTETIVASLPFAAGEFVSGKVIRMTAFGQITSASSADAVTFKIKLNGTVLGTITMVAKQVTNDPWDIAANLTLRTAGVGGVAAFHAHADIGDTTDHVNDNNVSFDTTAAQSLILTVQWNNAKATNIFRIDQGFIEILN